MGEVSGLNYKALGVSGNNQLGSNTKASGSKTNYSDGLSADELKKIDKNKDGVITEKEFKKVCTSKNSDKYWDAYTSFYKSTSSKSKDGSSTVTQTLANGNKVQSSFDKSGNLTGYKTIATNKDKSETTVAYNKSGEKSTKTIKYTNGSSTKYNYSTKSFTHTGADGSTVSTNSKGKVTSVKAGTTNVTFSYKSDKTDVKSVKIGDKQYSNVTTNSNGKVTVKDDKGNVVLTMKTKVNGETSVVQYAADGKRKETVNLNSDKEPKSVYSYDKNGYATKRVYSNTGVTRTFQRDSKGNLLSSTDYNKDGVKTSKQTYETTDGSKYFENNSDALWADRVFYDKNGKVTKYETYSYKKNSDKTVTKTTNTYTDTTKETQKTTAQTVLNSYKNKLTKETKNLQTGVTSKTQYNYRDYYIDKSVNYQTAYVSNKHLASTITTTGDKTVTKEYLHGVVVSTKTDKADSSDNNVAQVIVPSISNSSDQAQNDEPSQNNSSSSSNSASAAPSTSNDKSSNVDNSTVEPSKPKVDPELDYDEQTDSSGKVISGNYTLRALLKKLYPDMFTKQNIDIARKIAAKYNLAMTDKVFYDWLINTCQIELPEIYNKGYGIYVAVGYTDSDLY